MMPKIIWFGLWEVDANTIRYYKRDNVLFLPYSDNIVIVNNKVLVHPTFVNILRGVLILFLHRGNFDET